MTIINIHAERLLQILLLSCFTVSTLSAATTSDPNMPTTGSDKTEQTKTLSAAAKAAGLIAVPDLIPALVLDIRYATSNNFTGRQVYPAPRCWLQAEVAERLVLVQAELKKQGLGLKVFDCYRPFSVQEQLWQLVPDERYVGKPVRDKNGNPLEGSRHNRGAAVDLSLIDLASGIELPMPTDYDDFSERAHRDYTGNLDAGVIANRARLAAVMEAHGFSGLATEWWHFDASGWGRFALLDIALE